MGQISASASAGEKTTSYVARWIVPVEGEPIAGGCLVVRGETIEAVGPKRLAEGTVVDLGDVVVLPGLVNAHAHLEFSDLERPLGIEGTGFADWIRTVIDHRRRPDFRPWLAIRRGLDEALRGGTTTLGEIAAVEPHRWFSPAEGRPTVDVTAFQELIGLGEARAAQQAVELEVWASRPHSAFVRRGISPHAPYTVRPGLLSAAVAASAARRLPLAMHLAESRDELRLLHSGDGPLVELLRELGAWDDAAVPRGSRPLDYLRALAGSHRALVVHGNYLEDDDVAFLAQHADRMTVVYCPRTHAYFRHEPHPLPKLLAAGVSAALGTDGRSTNPDLDLLSEMRRTTETFPQLPPGRIVRLGTSDGARALGSASEIGSLVAGKRADCIVVRTADATEDPEAAVLAPGSRVDRVMRRGRFVVGDGP